MKPLYYKIINRILLIWAIMNMVALTFSTPAINKKASEGMLKIQKSRDKIDLCELLNWESFYLEYDLKALDQYVAAMINDTLMTENEGNNTLNKFIIENFKKVSEIRGRSDVDENFLFQDVLEIFIEYYIVDLFPEPENDFYYNHTYDLLLDQYGENTYPFMLQFNTFLMGNLVDVYESKVVKPLERCELYFIWAQTLLIGSTSLLGILGLGGMEEENSFLLVNEEKKIELKLMSKDRKRIKANKAIVIGSLLSLILTVISFIYVIIGLTQL